MSRILISGYYGFSNIGDDAILKSVVGSLRDKVPDSEITVLSRDPKTTTERYGVRAVQRMNAFTILRELLRCEMLISGGGSLLQDVTSRMSILYYLAIIFLAELFGKKVFIYSQGIGPINGGFNRRLTAKLLRKADAIAVRDQKSADFLTEIGVPADKIEITADPVLRLKPVELERGKEILESVGLKKTEGQKIVGFAVRSDNTAPELLQEIEKCVRWLRDEKNTCSVLIPFHYEMDKKVISELKARLGDGVYAIEDKHLSDEMLSIIGSLDILVGVRLHSLIYAEIMGVPSIAISYDPKIDAFMESIGRESMCGTADFTAERFKEIYEKVEASGSEMIEASRPKVNELINRLEINDSLVAGMIGDNKTKHAEKKSGVFSVIGGVMFISVVSRVFGILRESAQANAFGAADSYYSAYNKTIYLFSTAAYAMCVAAVPIMTRAFADNRKKGERVSNNLITLSLVMSLIVTALFEVATFLPVWGGESAETLTFIRIMALSLPIIVISYQNVALYQSLDHFMLQGSMALPYSVFLMLYLVLLGRRLGLAAYVVAVSAGWLLQLMMAFPYARKEKYVYKPVLELKKPYIADFLKTGIVTIVTGSMYLFCYLLDAGSAENMGSGTVTAFYYADKLFTPLTTTFIYSISAVLFPRLNREYTKQNKSEYFEYVWGVTSNTLVIVLPVCALLIVFGEQILKVLFESGSFTPEDTARAGNVFVMYALGMAGFSALDLLTKSFYAMGRTLAPLMLSIGIIALDFALNLVFGVSGELLALMTALSMTIGAILAIIVLFRGGYRAVKLGDPAKSLVASIIMGAAAFGLKTLLVNGAESKIMTVIKCGGIGVAVMAIYLFAAYILRIRTLTDIIKRKKG